MSAEENLKAMQAEYGLLMNADVDHKTLQLIVRRMLGRECQREEAMRDLMQNRETMQGRAG